MEKNKKSTNPEYSAQNPKQNKNPRNVQQLPDHKATIHAKENAKKPSEREIRKPK